MPADPERPEPVDPVPLHKQEPCAFGAEQPLVTVGGQEVDRRLAHVDAIRAKALDRVDEQGDPSGMAHLRERIEIVAEPGGELDVTDRQDPGRVIEDRLQILEPDPAIAAGHLPDRDPPAGQVHPGQEVRGIFVGGRHDVIAVAPGIALGNQADPLGRAVDESDFVAIGVDQAGDLVADRLKPPLVLPPADSALIFLGEAPFSQDLPGLSGQGSDRGVVEVGPVPSHGELGVPHEVPVDSRGAIHGRGLQVLGRGFSDALTCPR